MEMIQMQNDSNDGKTNKGGRKPTGTIQKTKDGRWRARITLADGTRKWLPPFPAGTSEQMAREKCAALTEKAQRLGLRRTEVGAVDRKKLAAAAKASCEGWVTLWNAAREAKGLTSSRVSKGHWTTYLQPVLGTKHPRDWTRDDFRKLSRNLDDKIAGGSCAWKTATNAWGTATKMADDACNAKDDAIRCRNDNPAEDVRGPDAGEKTAKQYLYPSEFEALMACEKVPLEWKRVFAVATYTYARLGELLALTWNDVDLDHGAISITRSIDSNTGLEKTTKSKCPRTIPIEPELMPLLVAMYAEAANLNPQKQPSGPVLRFPTKLHHANALREMLERAGVKRAALFTAGPSVKRIRFHDLRATGITWMAVRGDDPLKIKDRAGHTDFNTTQIYIRTADAVRVGFGEPFPALPKCLFNAGRTSDIVYELPTKVELLNDIGWAQQDLNLRLRPCEERTLPLSYAPDSAAPRMRGEARS